MRLKLLLACLLAALTPEPARGSQDVDYSNEQTWLCLPQRPDPCSRPLPTTALNPNGYGSTGLVRPASDPPIDCFYVYPTISRDRSSNSDFDAGPEEQAAATVQFARFGTVCRTFAPIYRQATLAALLGTLNGGATRAEMLEFAYYDIVNAFEHYLATWNRGRPFVLVGHSQGSIHLSRLLAERIEGRPEAARMLSAILLGFNIEVPEGRTAGGTFRSTPLCTARGQTGCVVTFVSFRAGNPPPADALFGRAAGPGRTVACTNPAALGGGPATLDSYWYAGPSRTAAQTSIAWSAEGAAPTPFLRTEGLVSAACVRRGPVGYLSVQVNADPADPRTDRIPGDVVLGGRVQPGWGLHLVDMNLAMGDLLALVEEQSAAFARRR